MPPVHPRKAARTGGQPGEKDKLPTPARIGSATTWVAVAANNGYTLALRQDGSLWAWGFNQSGQLGDGTSTDRSQPMRVGTDTWRNMAAGATHVVAVRTDGTLWAWGYNYDRQVGDGTQTTRRSPVQISSATTWASATAGATHSAALRQDGTLWAWGVGTSGQLGDGTSTSYAVPTRIGAATTWASLAAGSYYTMGIQQDGSLWAWGSNYDGQLGDGTTTERAAPVPVAPGTTWLQAGGNYSTSAAIRADGTLWTWGNNTYAQLGDGTFTARLAPGQVGTASTWQEVAVGDTHQLAQRTDGTRWAWGFNIAGEIGSPALLVALQSTPVQVGTDTNWEAITAGGGYSLGQRTSAALWGWGYNESGQLGDGTATNRPEPVLSSASIPAWASVVAGNTHTLGIRQDGTLWTWGDNTYGQLGTGTTTARLAPTQIGTASNWAQVSGGVYHSAALRQDGTLWAWGGNYYGQLGDGTTGTNRRSPVQIGAATNWLSVAAGKYHTLGIRRDGSLWAWGSNTDGELGDGTFIDQPAPAQVGTGTTWRQAAAGGGHTLALRQDGTLWGWGNNQYAQLGQFAGTPTPVAVDPEVTPLPVSLVAFTAQRTAPRGVHLAWTTATELRNEGFWVERSLDGVAFEALVFMAGAGNSAGTRGYGYDDMVPAGMSGAYYRLRQLDTDGSAQYSPVRVVAFGVTGPATGQLLAAPVPLYFSLAAPLAATDLTLTGATGQQLLRRSVSAPAGPGTLAVPELARLPAGLYLLRLTLDGQPCQVKVLKE